MKIQINNSINKLSTKDKALLKLLLVDHLPISTVVWLYQCRYKTMITRVERLLRLINPK